MKWQSKLGKKELKHLREMGVTTLAGAKRNAEHQARCRTESKAQGFNAGVSEPCWECRHINEKLGLPI